MVTFYRPYLLVGQGRYSGHKFGLLRILITPSHRPPPVNSDITIVFPDPDLVCRDTLLGGVPYFLAELLRPTAQPSCFPKKPGDPNSTMSSVPTTPSTLPPGARPLAQIVANTHETNDAASTTSNSSGGLNGAHRFVVVASSSHIVVDATCTNGHINSNS